MQRPNGQPRLSAEMMATADALRHIIASVSALVDAKNLAVMQVPATPTILVDGVAVAEALEVLAQRIGMTE